MANFISNVQYFGDGTDMPHIVSVRPIINGGRPTSLDAILNALAPTIVDRGKFIF
jgi:hypothetical protein